MDTTPDSTAESGHVIDYKGSTPFVRSSPHDLFWASDVPRLTLMKYSSEITGA